MGQITYALIEHGLSPKEILELPFYLKSTANDIINGEWAWTNPNMDIKFLDNYWNKKPDYFFTNSWNEEDFPWLKKENLSLDFPHPNLVKFDHLLNWYFFFRNDSQINEFKKLTKDIAELLKPVDMIIVPETFYDAVKENEGLTVEMFRRKAIIGKSPFIEVG
ncbi:hypothetical protein ACPPVU_01930 [Mucilaginibacter sp. McL0603]|uniref:hypothetical protein n=1 Tax=Mucilaginibacter sp. McL0603 TaxID=3415670 RepID=UPI003CEC4E57